MAALAKAATAGAVAGFDIELGDEGNDGWQVGLELHDQPWIEQRSVAVGAFGTGHINDAVDLVGGGCRANVGGMAVLAAGFFAAFFQLAAAKTRGLAVVVAAQVLDFLAEAEHFAPQVGDACLKTNDFLVAFDAAGTERR